MFSAATYERRRETLLASDEPASGLVLLLGNEQTAMNYRANPYPFRQDSTFLYYFGIDEPGLAGILDLDEGTSRLYGDDPDLDEVVWMGQRPTVREYADRSGIPETSSLAALPDDVATALRADRPVHVLPP